ncbi:hypothetical protein [Streptomyces sp. BE133]|uniref:hypothetical protein n=1 Tax=Streptomyces sp. BE133 TaxID=3002523 RepID=UPI002E7A0F3D|nr:hypothetical protein [Streptomyces sp. BE133]MEE1812622.1 hypothetical protein [Streptomyces sp. BE133]
MTGHAPKDGYITFILTPEQIRLGDITDHPDGPLRIAEITQRRSTWTLGGKHPDDYTPIQELEAPPLVRHVVGWNAVRIYRKPAYSERLRIPGHTRTIKSHNPVRRGCYTHVDGWDASCSCGWASPTNPQRGKNAATGAFLLHQVEVLTAATVDKHPNLAQIESIEQQLGERLVWEWRSKHASAELAGNEDAIRTRMGGWASALGTEVIVTENPHCDPPQRLLRVSAGSSAGWGGSSAGFDLRAELAMTDALI